MKKLTIIFFLFSFVMANAQQLDKKLNNCRYEIVHSFKEYGEIANKNEVDSLQYKYLYSRKLAIINSKFIYYELGRMTDHGYKFIGVYKDGMLTIFPSKDFCKDFNRLIEPFKNEKYKSSKLSELLLIIKGIYDYNANPPWQLNLDTIEKK